jgi:hypothetical protein
MVAYERTQAAPAQSVIESFTPFGMQLVIALNWIGGLSGIMLGTLSINQGFFERFFDTQFLLIGQGGAMSTLGAAMFITATGMVSGTIWSLDYAKRVAGLSIIWSALGITLAVYSAYNMPGLSASLVMYAIVVWLLVFGIGLGLFGFRYLSLNSASVRRYAEYVTTETLSEDRMLPPARYEGGPTGRALPYAARGRYCSNCGGIVRENSTTCPRCGAKTDVTSNVS